MGQPESVATGVDADVVVAALEAIGTTHVVTVPDTHQRTVLALVEERARPPLVRATTEDDVLGICVGLWMAGARPVALIQQLGLFASVNALRAFTHDQHVPLAILAGLYGRLVDRPVDATGQPSAVARCRALLDALGLRCDLIERAGDAGRIGPGLQAAFDGPTTSVVLLGAATR